MNAKDCQVLLNGQPVQNFILFCGETKITSRIQNINLYSVIGILREAIHQIEDYFATQGKFTIETPQTQQQAKITIGGVELNTEVLQKVQQQSTHDEVIEKMQTRIEELERILKAKEGIASGYV